MYLARCVCGVEDGDSFFFYLPLFRNDRLTAPKARPAIDGLRGCFDGVVGSLRADPFVLGE